METHESDVSRARHMASNAGGCTLFLEAFLQHVEIAMHEDRVQHWYKLVLVIVVEWHWLVLADRSR